MSRTDLDPTTLAASLRRMAGDGSVEWVMEPMQTRVLLDVADMLDENAKLRELLQRLLAEYRYMSVRPRKVYMQHERRMRVIEEEMRELGVEVD